jgi:hypothetical protein
MSAITAIGYTSSLRSAADAVYEKWHGQDFTIYWCTESLARLTSYATKGLSLHLQLSMPPISGSQHVQQTYSGQQSQSCLICVSAVSKVCAYTNPWMVIPA